MVVRPAEGIAVTSTRFVKALMAEGATKEEAGGIARLITKIAIRGAGYPFTISVMVGTRNCEVTADVEGNALVLKSVTALDVGHRKQS